MSDHTLVKSTPVVTVVAKAMQGPAGPQGATGAMGAPGVIQSVNGRSGTSITLTAADVAALALSAFATVGSLLYTSAAATAAEVAPNATTTRKFLSQSGNGTVASAPAWAQPSTSDITATAGTNAIFGSSVDVVQRGLDALVQSKVKSATTTAQPGSPSNGDTYLLPTSSTGAAWAGNDGKIARYSSVTSAWEFYTPQNGWETYAQDTGTYWFYVSGAWTTQLNVGGNLAVVGVATLSNGTVGTPALNFGDATTGFYRPSANQIAATFSGTQYVALAAGSATLGANTQSMIVSVNGAASTTRSLAFNTAGVNRWILQVDSTAESGSNAGSNLNILGRTDAGGGLGTWVSIKRATGDVTLGSTTASTSTTTGALVVSGGLGAAGNINLGGTLSPTATASSTQWVSSQLTGDSQARFGVFTDGLIKWGPGNAAFDVTLARAGVQTLSLTGALTSSGQVTITGGGISVNSIKRSGNFTLTTGQMGCPVDASAGAVTITLPASPGNGQIYSVSKIDSSANAVTLSGNGKNIGTSASISISVQGQCRIVQYDSSVGAWVIIAGYL